MHAKARAWIEDGVIRCCSQMCEVGGVPCPRIEKCEVVEVEIREVDNHAAPQEKRTS